MKKIVLASGSPRRRDILAGIGANFEVLPANVDEIAFGKTSAYEIVKILSEKKALACLKAIDEDALIIGADTLVAINGQIMGKPKDEASAFAMLKRLQGCKHSVYTGATVINKTGDSYETASIVDNTSVYLRKLEDEEIRAYIATREPFDKAGAYAIQGLGTLLVEKIEGDYNTVVGLPLVKLHLLLKRWGVDLANQRRILAGVD
ncbi:MAG: Maf family protein [Clostridiales bacterium]|jgi:septum formation protein|nr:Maf family protein [Clostridiales bacterium]